ncbi:MAG: hypothetical protein KME54_15795 [Tolypothrix brevis GSE-NOS-MK-07-07A]|nr:hypothetical protein [Tolypothrix brevis GSE-NOS-MK-07-07A]
MNNPSEPSKKLQAGKIVVNSDEWTLSNTGFTQAPDTATFVTNIAKWFTEGRSTGKFHAYSTNFGLTESVLAETLTKAGYTWTVGKNIKIDLPTLLTFDGIFLCGDLADNQVLIDYVKAGGNVYLGAGTGVGGPQPEADRWNTFLNAFGFKFVGEYNGISGNETITSSHPIFAGVKAIYLSNGNSIADLEPDSQANEVILTHTGGQGLIGAFTGSERTVEPSKKLQAGKIVVNSDEWTLSNTGFTQAPDTATFVTNIAKWFTEGRSTGKFHAYSTNFGLTESVLAETLTKAGYTWTVGKNIKIDLPTLLTFDGIFLCGDLADNQVLIDYVKAGGNVYLGAGTGVGGPQPEADRWNTFLNAFGFKFVGEYNGISGNETITSSHPIFAGVKAIYLSNGNSIADLEPDSQANEVILTHTSGQGLIGAFTGSEKTGQILPVKTTESEQTQTLWQIGYPGQIGKESSQPGVWQPEVTYVVGSDQDPVNKSSMPFLLIKPGLTPKPKRNGKKIYSTDKLNIRFLLDQTYDEGELILIYDFFGSETDTLSLDGKNIMRIVGAGEGKVKQNQIPLGKLNQGEHTLTMTTDEGNGWHWIDYLRLLFNKRSKKHPEVEPIKPEPPVKTTQSEQKQMLWQIGYPGQIGKESSQSGGWQPEVTYVVGSDQDPVNKSSMPFLLVKPGLTPKPKRNGKEIYSTDKLNIRFLLDQIYDEGELILIYDFFGSETDTLSLDGKNIMRIVGAGEGKVKQNQIPLGVLNQGEHTLTITTDEGNGSHWIDYLGLLFNKKSNTQQQVEPIKPEPVVPLPPVKTTQSEQTQTLWQIGYPGQIGKESSHPGGWQPEVTYVVGSDQDPVNKSSMPFLLVKPGLTPKPKRNGKEIYSTDKLNIRFLLDQIYDEGELILIYDFFGSETDTLSLDGKNIMRIVGAGEGKVKQNQIPLGVLNQGEHTLTITTDEGNGSHWIDYLGLLLNKRSNTQQQVEPIKPEPVVPSKPPATIEQESKKSKQKEKKGKEINSQEGRRKKANTIILEFGSQKKDHIRDFTQGRGRLLKKVAQVISELQEAGEIDDGVQPVIVIIRQKKSRKTYWD